jgi:hypothetical protein
MFALGFTYLLSALCSWPALAQEAQGPKMVLKERAFDFNKVREGEVISHAFEVRNEGDQALEIIRVRPG